MRNREPYQIIIMRPTGERPVITLRSFWARLILISIIALVTAVVFMTVMLLDARHTGEEQERTIAMRAQELKDLNILLMRKDEEIISLKKKLSMSITHKAVPVPEVTKPLPKLFPPIVEITDVSIGGDRLLFKIVNLKSQQSEMAKGYVYAVFKKGDDYACYPDVKLDEGLPVEKNKGHAFTIKNYKPMSIKMPQTIESWDTVNLYIFDDEEKLRLAMPVNRVQLQ